MNMLDFEKFPVYQKSILVVEKIQPLFRNPKVNLDSKDQLYRASSSIMLNIAEGAGKISKKDKKKFYSIAKGSAQECIAILTLLKTLSNITEMLYNEIVEYLYEIVKMLSGLIKAMSK